MGLMAHKMNVAYYLANIPLSCLDVIIINTVCIASGHSIGWVREEHPKI